MFIPRCMHIISQIDVGHDIINTGHAKTDTDVLKNTRLYKL